MSYQTTFENETKLSEKEYEECLFKNCDFSNGNFSGVTFINCIFEGCNLSLAKLTNTSLQKVHFKGSKLMGVNFEACKDFGLALRFDDCVLDFTSFVRKKIATTVFKNCRLAESNFDQSDLTKAVFDHCDLKDTLFSKTILNGVDFRTAKNFLIDPEMNSIKKTRFMREDLMGLLYRHDIIIE